MQAYIDLVLQSGEAGRELDTLSPSSYVVHNLLDTGKRLKQQSCYSPGYSPQSISRLRKAAFSFQHGGCVNTCNFNAKGTLLLSGSDDLDVKIWRSSTFLDVSEISLAHAIHTQHANNIFHVEFVPLDDGKIISGAADGELRLHDLVGLDSERLLHRFAGKMVNHFCFNEAHNAVLTAAFGRTGGCVEVVDLRASANTRTSIVNVLHSPVKQVVSCPWDGNQIAVGVGAEVWFCDLRRQTVAVDDNTTTAAVMKWNMLGVLEAEAQIRHRIGTFFPRSSPDPVAAGMDVGGMRLAKQLVKLRGLDLTTVDEEASISSLQYSAINRELLVSYQRDRIYRFACRQEEEGGDGVETSPLPVQLFCGAVNEQTFLKRAAYFGPQEEYVVCGGDGGYLYVFASQTGELVTVRKADENGVVNGVLPSPALQCCLVSYGLDSQARLWTVSEKKTNHRSKIVGEALGLAQRAVVEPQRRHYFEEEPYKTVCSYSVRLARMRERVGNGSSASLTLLALDRGVRFDTTLDRLVFCRSEMEQLRLEGNDLFRSGGNERFAQALSKFAIAAHYGIGACALFSTQVSSTDMRVRHMQLACVKPEEEETEAREEREEFDKIYALLEIVCINAAAAAHKLVPVSSGGGGSGAGTEASRLAALALAYCDQAILVNEQSIKAHYRRYTALMLLGKRAEANLEMERIKALPNGKEWIRKLRS